MVSEDNQESMSQVASSSSSEAGLTYIEQLQIASSKPCTNDKSPYLIGVNVNENKTILSKAACKLWSCETCGARNARKWIARILYLMATSEQTWSMLTITAGKKARKAQSISNLRQGWKKLSNRITSSPLQPTHKISFVRVWEQHEDGSFHNHVLINCCYGTRWAKDNSAECGLGFMADWRELENAGQAVGYVAKYTLKNANVERGGVSWPKGLRRIELSRNWPKLPEIEAFSDYSWSISTSREYQKLVGDNLRIMGFEVIDLTS